MKKVSILTRLMLLILSVMAISFSIAGGQQWESQKVPVKNFTKDTPVVVKGLPSEYIPDLKMEIEVIHRGSLIKETLVTFRAERGLTLKDIDPLKFGILTLKPLSSFSFGAEEIILDSGGGSILKRAANGKGLLLVEGGAYLLPLKK